MATKRSMEVCNQERRRKQRDSVFSSRNESQRFSFLHRAHTYAWQSLYGEPLSFSQRVDLVVKVTRAFETEFNKLKSLCDVEDLVDEVFNEELR